MKIAVMTIHNALNFGAIFQAYATQEILSKYGSVDVVNYENKHIEKLYSPFNVKFDSSFLKSLVRETLLLKSKVSKKNKFEVFFNTKLNFTKKVDFVNETLETYDVYVSGSDQIWNPKITNGVNSLNEKYFLSFAPENTKKISYASSLGNYRFNTEQERRVKQLLETFASLAVREQDGVEYLEPFLNRKVKQVLDPTLLLSKDDWINKLKLKENKSSEEYILVYTVPRAELLKDAINFYAKQGIKVISVDSAIRKTGNVDKQIRDAGPEEFLNLFLNAKMILTDSFHGVCFSINFQKDFLAISSGVVSNRMRNILSLVGMENRLIESVNDFEKVKPITNEEYRKSFELLEVHKKVSFDYLDKALIG